MSTASPLGRRIAILALYVAVALSTRAPFVGLPCLDLDEAAQLLGSWEVLRGGTLYVDFADNRPPLLYGFGALAQQLLGRGLPAVRLATALVVLPLTAFAASAFHRHGRRGTVAGVLYLVYGAAFLAHDMHSVSPEVLMLLPLAWAVALLRDEEDVRSRLRLLGAGALVGAGVLFRQQAGLWLPALGAAAWVAPVGRGGSERRGARLVALLVGFSLPLLTTLLFFVWRGAARELVFWTLTQNLGYAANPIPLAEALERAASYLLPFLIATAPLWWAAGRSRSLVESRSRRLLLDGLILASLPAVFLGFRFYPHYFIQLYLPLALAAAPWTETMLRRPLGRAGRLAVAWPAGLLLGFTVANLMLYRGPGGVYEETRPVFADVAARLRSDPCYGSGPLFVWGFAPQFYTESGLRPASRFVVPQASLTGYVPGNRASRSGAFDSRALVRTEHWGMLMEDLERRPPVFVLDTAPAGLHGWDRYPLRDFRPLEHFVKSDYDAIGVVDGVWIWRRRGCEAAYTARPLMDRSVPTNRAQGTSGRRTVTPSVGDAARISGQRAPRGRARHFAGSMLTDQA